MLDPKVVDRLLARKANEARSPLLGLTDRERDVLEAQVERVQVHVLDPVDARPREIPLFGWPCLRLLKFRA